jgi:peptidoglycan/LPS O-acetylase OafA/YrhL
MSLVARTATENLIRPVMPELDSLRGVAILLVVFFHGFDSPAIVWSQLSLPARLFFTACLGGWTGVYLFFVLSGFLITGILLDSKPKPQYYRRFYIRRALRILPAFYLLLLLLIVLPRIGWLAHRNVGWPFVALSFLYLANMTTLFAVPGQYAALWSLAVEEHFYLVWPAVVRRLSRRAIAWCAFGIFLLSPVIRAGAYWLHWNPGAGYTWLAADGLAIGALLGTLSRGWLAERIPMRKFSILCTSTAVAVFVAGTPFGIWRGVTFTGAVFRLSAVNLFCAGILGFTLLVGTSRFKWMVQWRWLRWFGEISYGLYLFHMLAFDFADHWIIRFSPAYYPQVLTSIGPMFMRFLVSMGIAVGAAFLSRKYFEERFLKLKERWTAPTSAMPPGPQAIAKSREVERRTA